MGEVRRFSTGARKGFNAEGTEAGARRTGRNRRLVRKVERTVDHTGAACCASTKRRGWRVLVTLPRWGAAVLRPYGSEAQARVPVLLVSWLLRSGRGGFVASRLRWIRSRRAFLCRS